MWFALDATLIEQANVIVGDGKILDNFVWISSNLKIRHTPVPGFDCCNIYDRSDTLKLPGSIVARLVISILWVPSITMCLVC